MKKKNTPLEIDASQGEGGGQILRTALALSIITQTPIVVDNIRAKRSKPGLMRQHLTCVRAAQAISGASVKGDELGSQRLEFTPHYLRGGDYQFAIGTAGSCALVLQTILWPLLFAEQASTITLEGGTHVPMAPCFEFLELSFLPALRKMGVVLDIELLKHGFYPGGGGQLRAKISPWTQPQALHLLSRGEALGQHALALIANLDHSIAERQLKAVRRHLKWGEDALQHQGLRNSHGVGNTLILSAQFSDHTEVVTSHGDKGRTSEKVAQIGCDEMKAYLESKAAIGEHLADQLLLPIALVGGEFTCNVVSLHCETNCAIIARFLEVSIHTTALSDRLFRISCEPPAAQANIPFLPKVS